MNKWGKVASQSCIYCSSDIHDGKHLLFECPSLDNIWKNISETLNILIMWKTIVIGENSQPGINFCVSMIDYVIYKKYLVDKGKDCTNGICPINKYVQRELAFRLEALDTCDICSIDIKINLRRICENLK